MTDKVFWTDPYLTQLDATVVDVQGPDIRVDRTIFYAASGGQESDTGTIAGCAVLMARKDGGDITYTLASDHGLRMGDRVRMVIDWDRRYRLMRLHLAAEIVLELAGRHFGSAHKTGAHIAPDKARIDFALDHNIRSEIGLLEQSAMDLIKADRPVISAFSDERRERRFWRIEGFAQVPCGGTHLRHTGEIGDIQLKRRNPGRGTERIEIRLRA